ncbi:PC4-domain-containing protein [Massarina eburnea CBS 473.64]|uniref:PC4-domain-containing protein n=1 Tax=Massarina eburnea CBS 473.64 TaxID=1395130 RepID=A0A6A6RYB8_9PLEO|nr:PC4-domain-containing protein [Massarina eburnea CBS 473.64]
MAGTYASKRGGARGGFKKGFKRAEPDSDDTASRASKKAKSNEEDDNTPLVQELEVDDDENSFVALKANGTRRVTISDFKGKTLVSIREYYEDANGDMKPGKKGISLSIEQYNALLSAAPLLETTLVAKEENVVRPDYNAEPVTPTEPTGCATASAT